MPFLRSWVRPVARPCGSALRLGLFSPSSSVPLSRATSLKALCLSAPASGVLWAPYWPFMIVASACPSDRLGFRP